MPLIIPEGFANITLVFEAEYATRRAVTSFGVQNDGDLTPPAIKDAVLDASTDLVANCVHQNAALVAIDVKVGPNETGGMFSFPVTSSGDVGGDPLSPNCAILLRKFTALGGRSMRGRMYMPFTSEAIVDGAGRVSAVNVEDISEAAESMRTDLVTANLAPVLFHNDAPPPPTVLVALFAESFIATQRRRLVRS